MAARTGKEFLAGLRSPREVWVDREKVDDVASHPAFVGAAATLAEIFDLQHQAREVCLTPDAETGEPINLSHMIPRSLADLERRHACLQTIAEFTVGLMGRTPDYMNVTFAGFAGCAHEWAVNGNDRGAANLVSYQKFLARKDLSLTHTIVHLTIDKSKGDVPEPGNEVALHKVADTAHGIVVRGARILATLAPFADEIAVMATGWYPNIMQQTMIRAQTKLEFAYGLASRMAEAINDFSPATRQMLGEIWTCAEFARAAIHSAEIEAFDYSNGVWFPNGGPLAALRAALPTWFPRVSEIITLIGSHNLLAAPTEAQLHDPKLRPLIDRYLRDAGDMKSEERARIFRLAWDFVGSALAGRNELYERFYLASGARNYQLAHSLAPKERALRLVDELLGLAPRERARSDSKIMGLPRNPADYTR
jgi:aromatic ring hydroxylase